MTLRFYPLTLLVVLGTAPTSAAQLGNFTYQPNGAGITITRFFCQEGKVAVPDTIEGLPVTAIEDSAFRECTGLVDITIPESVTRIGPRAFADCRALTRFRIPDGVTHIEDGAFGRCVSLTDVSISDTVTAIGEGTFSDCSSLTAVTIPSGVTRIGEYAFSGCTSLTAIRVDDRSSSFFSLDGVLFDYYGTTLILCPLGKSGGYAIPDGVTRIAKNAFSWCSRLTELTIPDSVTTIGEESFSFCHGLTELTMPDSVIDVGRSAFLGCYGLTNITWSTGVTRIETYAFAYCTNLAALVIPDVVLSIGNSAFAGCMSLTSVTIPHGVTSVGDYAFQACSSLTNATLGKGVSQLGLGVFDGCDNLNVIDVDVLNPVYSSLEGVLFDRSRSTLLHWPEGKTGHYTIPAGVGTIEDRAFFRSTRLTGVTIPDSVTRIGKLAFAQCNGLTDVMIPGSVNRIEESAFGDCQGLTKVSIEEGVSCIEAWTFAGCISLSEIGLPDNVTTIGASAFNGCSSLPRLDLPRSLVSIGESAFGGCARLTTLEVDVLNPAFSTLDGVLFDKVRTTLILCPEGKAGDYAIPDGVSRIGERAFSYCTQLSSIAIPDSVTELGDYAMTGCYSLSSVRIPPYVTAIGARPFSGSTNLSVIEVDPANIAFSSHEGVLIDRAAAAVMVCPEGKIGMYTIPEGIVSIGDYAFARCTRLTTLTVPQTVATLGEWTFFNCTHLTAAYFAGEAPDTADWSSVFVEVPGVIVFYRAGMIGWTPTPPFLNRPTAKWLDRIQYSDWLPTSGLPRSFPEATAEADDPDGDGMSNVAEMLAGTDPSDRNSVLVLEREPRPDDLSAEDRGPLRPDQHALYFRSVPGKQYALQWNDSLSGPPPPVPWTSWSPTGLWRVESVMTAVATQTRAEIDYPASAFYRIILAQ